MDPIENGDSSPAILIHRYSGVYDPKHDQTIDVEVTFKVTSSGENFRTSAGHAYLSVGGPNLDTEGQFIQFEFESISTSSNIPVYGKFNGILFSTTTRPPYTFKGVVEYDGNYISMADEHTSNHIDFSNSDTIAAVYDTSKGAEGKWNVAGIKYEILMPETVPEPGAFAMIGMLGVFLAFRRCRNI